MWCLVSRVVSAGVVSDWGGKWLRRLVVGVVSG